MSGPFGSGSFGTGVFSNSPLYSTGSLIDAILRDTSHSSPSTETNKRLVVLGFINNRYARVTSSHHWDWLYQTLDSNFNEPYETGTISVTQGSESVTGSGTSWSANVVPNNVLIPSGRSERYLIESVSSTTALTLEGEYAGETSSDLDYSIVKPIYELPSNCEHVQSILVHGVGELVPMGTQEFRRKQASDPTLVGPPRWFTEVGRRAQDGIRHIEVYPAPDQNYAVQLNYGVNIMKLEDSTSNYPLIPDRHRVVLYYGGLAEMYRYLRDPVNAEAAERDFDRTLLLMLNDTQLTQSRLQFMPARNYRSRSRRRTFRVAMDRYDFGRED